VIGKKVGEFFSSWFLVNQSRISLFSILASLLLYYLLLYETPREDFWRTALLWGLLFVGYFGMVWGRNGTRKSELKSESGEKKKKDSFIWLMGGAIAFRLIAWFALPELSDDYFRFVWDGRLWTHGENPFSQLPSAYAASEYAGLGLNQTLFDNLNSPDYHTIYPPVCQGIFYLAAFIFPDNIYASVLVMKSFFFFAELGSIWLIIQLLKHWKKNIHQVFLYALNPLVIVELCGNLHFECLMIFFLLLSLWLLVKVNWQLSAIAFGLAVSSKLIPLMFLPLLILRIGLWRSVGYGSLVLFVTIVGFLPIFDLETFLHLLESVQLYFQNFEFNASIYYLVRAVGKLISGYNLIRYIGPGLSLLTIVGILWLSFRKKEDDLGSMPVYMMAVLLLYLLFATTVHPWYTTTLVALATFTSFRFPYIWSFLLIFTYSTYVTAAYQEQLWVAALEYGLLFVVLYLERKKWFQEKEIEN
jgi:hypothetical protein